MAENSHLLKIADDLEMEFVLIPPGTFLMGSSDDEVEAAFIEARRYSPKANRDWIRCEQPPHQVTINQPFYLGKFQVTQAQWQIVMKTNPSRFQGATLPVERVSFTDCQRFLKKLTAGNDTFRYRLPSEAEWEYACRAGTTTPFSTGMTISVNEVNYNGKYPYAPAPKGKYRKKTTPVGSFSPNPWGLYDMHGNVWEWCQDRHRSRYEGAPTDGSAWEHGLGEWPQVIRGGSCHCAAGYCRSASRIGNKPDDAREDLGIRVVATLR